MCVCIYTYIRMYINLHAYIYRYISLLRLPYLAKPHGVSIRCTRVSEFNSIQDVVTFSEPNS